MSSKWKRDPNSDVKSHSGYTVGQAMANTNKPYSVTSNNCMHTSKNVHNQSNDSEICSIL